MRRTSTGLVLLASALTLSGYAQNPAQDGAWERPFDLPLIAIHSALLPTGKVLLFSAEHGVPGIHGWLLDPVTLALTEVPPPPPWNPDCSGHSYLHDGRLLVTGGTLSFTPLTGTAEAYTFDPFTEQWTQVEDMAGGRWYPTNVTLGNGTVLTMAGLSEVSGTDNPDIELWDPNGLSNWQLLGQRSLPYYPLLHLLPDGLVFLAGPSPATETYDPATGAWTPVATTNFPGRYEASSVLLPPTLDRVLLVGGYTSSGPPTNTAEIIDLSSPAPSWTSAGHMASPRMEHDALILPDGSVLVVGGRSNSTGTPNPVLTPEILDPAGVTWDSMAPHAIPRMYHSTTILLPDARVLAAGGDFQPSGEIYSPPFLFRGTRPTITSAPAAIAYGETFSLGFTSDHGQNQAVLIRPSCVTHSNNMSQRLINLGSIGAPAASTPVGAPTSPDEAPPGYYMLFVLDDGGVPSVSAMVRVITRLGDFDQDDDVDAADQVAFEECFTGPSSPLAPPCEPGDFDRDGDVDCDDAGGFRLAWTEPGSPGPLPACSFCDGSDNSLLSCPCGNAGDPDTGCDIQQGTGGVRLDVVVQQTIPQNRATVTGTGYPSASTPTAIVIRAPALDPASPVVFGDGLRCIGVPLVRLAATFASGGVSAHSFGHGAVAGQGNFYYQLWFRNTPAMFCDAVAAFNLSNGRALSW